MGQPRRVPEDEHTEEEVTCTHLPLASARATRNLTSSILHRLAWMCSACEWAWDWRRRLARTGVTPVAPQHRALVSDACRPQGSIEEACVSIELARARECSYKARTDGWRHSTPRQATQEPTARTLHSSPLPAPHASYRLIVAWIVQWIVAWMWRWGEERAASYTERLLRHRPATLTQPTYTQLL